MFGDTILIEPHHRKAAEAIAKMVVPLIKADVGKYTLTVAGESGAGKSEIASAVAEELTMAGIHSVIFQQDDYFVYPPKTNDRTRRDDIAWVGPQEVRLDLLDSHLLAFIKGENAIEKPLVYYNEDRIDSEVLDLSTAKAGIAEGTYTSRLENVNTRIFIDRDYRDTKKHRERRNRDASELDDFINRVLTIEHEIISADKARADIVVNSDYSVSSAA